jgi:hypothetical protein
MLYRIVIAGSKGMSLHSADNSLSLSVTLYNTKTTKHRHIRLCVCVCVRACHSAPIVIFYSLHLNKE